MQAQIPLAKREALKEVGNHEFVTGLEVQFRYPAGSRIVKRESCQSEQKPEGTPFNDLGRLDVLVVTIKNEICANKDILLVRTELRMRIDNAKKDEGPGLKKALFR